MPDGFWKKGDKDPQAGVPFRHARNKAALMLSDASESVMRDALCALLLDRPNEVLDALIKAIETEEALKNA